MFNCTLVHTRWTNLKSQSCWSWKESQCIPSLYAQFCRIVTASKPSRPQNSLALSNFSTLEVQAFLVNLKAPNRDQSEASPMTSCGFILSESATGAQENVHLTAIRVTASLVWELCVRVTVGLHRLARVQLRVAPLHLGAQRLHFAHQLRDLRMENQRHHTRERLYTRFRR